jgi:Ala-tRNA(Pro) deacylase
MDKQEIYEMLRERGVRFEAVEHKAVYNMDDLKDVELPYPERDAKNLFLRDDKKRNFYLVTVSAEKRVDLKQFRKEHGTRPLSFASEKYLGEILGLEPGSVTPLGLLNDEDRKVALYLDKEFFEEPAVIGVHPNDNTATVYLRTEDLVQIVKEHGNEVEVVEIED